MQNNSFINLESILSLGNQLSQSLDVEFILSASLLSLMGKLLSNKGCGFIRVDDKFKQIVCKGANENICVDLLIDNGKIFDEITVDSELYQKGYNYLVYLKNQQEIIGLLLIGKRLARKELNADEINYIKIVGSITSTALSNAINYNHLKNERDVVQRQNLLLRTLLEISNDFKHITSRESIVKIFSLYLKGNLRVNRHAILLLEGSNLTELVNNFGKTFNLEQINKFTKLQKIQVLNKTNNDFADELTANVSIICPLIYQGQFKGLLLIGNRLDNQEFTDENLAFLELLSNSLITALENNRLFLEELKKEKLEQEINLAREIQNNLLPKQIPLIEGWEIAGQSNPSRSVGGDYFDIIKYSDNYIYFVIADISGKGFPAALLMANLQASIRTLINLNLKLQDIIEKVNSLLYLNTGHDKFATVFLAKLDLASSELEYINAGHNPPIIVKHNKEVHQLTEGSLLLGVMEELPYISSHTIKLDYGDIILIYTDGVSEALNSDNEEFGLERIINYLLNQTPSLDELFEQVRKFVGNREQYDDMTAILIKKEQIC